MSADPFAFRWRQLTLTYLLPAAIVVLGLGLRLYRIDYQSLWFDEALSVVIGARPFDQIADAVMTLDAHPPLYHYLLHAWFRVFGLGDWQARSLSAVFGSLSILAVYLVANRLFGRLTALVAAALIAVSQIGVMYSQEARPYAQQLFIFAATMYCVLIALARRSLAFWSAAVVGVILVAYTHYWALFGILALAGFAMIYRRRYPLPISWIGVGALAGCLALAPWYTGPLFRQLETVHGASALGGTQPSYFSVRWSTPFSTMNRFNNGMLNGFSGQTPPVTYLVGAVLFTVPALLALAPLLGRRRELPADERSSLAFLAMLWLIPLGIVLSLSVVAGIQYDSRYVAFCVAPYYILVARGLVRLQYPALRIGAVAAAILYSCFALKANFFLPYKENYRDALALIVAGTRPGDCVIFLPWGAPLQWSIYHGAPQSPQVAEVGAVLSGQVDCKRAWVSSYGRVSHAVDFADQQKRKLETAFRRIDGREFFWSDVDLYERDGPEPANRR